MSFLPVSPSPTGNLTWDFEDAPAGSGRDFKMCGQVDATNSLSVPVASCSRRLADSESRPPAGRRGDSGSDESDDARGETRLRTLEPIQVGRVCPTQGSSPAASGYQDRLEM